MSRIKRSNKRRWKDRHNHTIGAYLNYALHKASTSLNRAVALASFPVVGSRGGGILPRCALEGSLVRPSQVGGEVVTVKEGEFPKEGNVVTIEVDSSDDLIKKMGKL